MIKLIYKSFFFILGCIFSLSISCFSQVDLPSSTYFPSSEKIEALNRLVDSIINLESTLERIGWNAFDLECILLKVDLEDILVNLKLSPEEFKYVCEKIAEKWSRE